LKVIAKPKDPLLELFGEISEEFEDKFRRAFGMQQREKQIEVIAE
jgi:hypothetical protein